ncbi:hypothetical protein C8R44DRAFT_739225 [Mycena epipterygia]|nr:hypothetical protein C8R44DRAFT_739225 [Mycena epipterygia]
MSAFNHTSMSASESAHWAPSMPNSDLWTLKSAKEAARDIAPNSTRIVPRRVVGVRTLPRAYYPDTGVHAYEHGLAPAPAPAAAPHQAHGIAVSLVHIPIPVSAVLASSQAPQQPRSRAIGLGHPSTSKRRNLPLESDSPASPQASSHPHTTRINSSTIKRRTERFPGRELHAIAEDPIAEQRCTSRPVPGTRRCSYAAATSIQDSSNQTTGRRVTPTPGSPRCASKPRNTSASCMTALAPRYTSSGSPQGGPTQVQSPRLLFPATMAGSPLFQSLDGAVQAITAAGNAHEKKAEDGLEGEYVYYEDALIKFKVQAKFRIRVAAKRFTMLF